MSDRLFTVLRRRTYLLFGFGLLILLNGCEKRFNNPITKKYEIKGTLFEGYDAPVISDYPLELVYYEMNSRKEWINQKSIERIRTDNDGYFEFRYSKFSKSKTGKLAIIQDASGLKEGQAFVSEPFLQGVPINQDLYRNIASIGLSRLIVNFTWNGSLDSDTLFINASGMRAAKGADFKETRQSAWGFKVKESTKFLIIKTDLQWDSNLDSQSNSV